MTLYQRQPGRKPGWRWVRPPDRGGLDWSLGTEFDFELLPVGSTPDTTGPDVGEVLSD